MKRIITCQGSIQLIAALSVLAHRGQPEPCQNYLIIYELYAPGQQHYEFANFIRQMAESVCNWDAIVYLAPEQLHAIGHKLDSTRPQQIYTQVHHWIGIDRADEIYLSRNWQFTNQLILNAYPSAYRICYGDGIGLYFSEQSAIVRRPFTPPPTRDQLLDWTWWKLRSLWHRIRERLKLKTKLYSPPFDIGYFVLPDIFGETPPMPSIKLPDSLLLNQFAQFTSFISEDQIAKIRAIPPNSEISILLTSNFSEGDRLSQSSEIESYCEFLQQFESASRSLLIIKPHPRDDPNKIKQLQQLCTNFYPEVIVLSDANLFFLPFEVFFLKAFSPPYQNIRIFAVSSAFISLHLLFNISSTIGFGTKQTTKSFDPDFIEARLEHEQTLQTALDRLIALKSEPDML
ncbi:MAG: alpha-2,8-polysialyltransferase family protein [Leptolyngbya sp. Prado105]|jgi:hypothetical protein|nr:alpha-2,8-polysialyltransferase family protein [Leptolyngbya sp. Prado105]